MQVGYALHFVKIFLILLSQAFNKYNTGQVRDILDPLLQEVVHEEILKKIFSLAFLCTAPTRGDRPEMKEVGEQLWKIRMDYLRSRGRL